ncbi:hypothetical protein EN904_10600 [Mesorhizobium sp. M7A.F.Ca.CA.001.07.2.1]|uniref:hypothetical protein n=1 Tax=Mesorhizobium TaxID=68287 RepID=UPI000FCA8F64|nr:MULTISPECIES: hypothetical protein [Mesorhizobium]RVB48715.1 hypothetical protein EN918_01335 [Mesorhizobium sp. M7A.F.Ca.CA.004.05.1.1]MCF6126083.1 hypothetical protein [Mesorhizobium ciceri]MCQ8813882.1 hypothetical protein [Mesorhizobium sp. SEMIA396]RUX79329.1 hypothetical protein EN983_12580 [Mesorhizobium sp. M7A.F.Ca.CA.004.08.2.1]RUX89410.1 hypothetical protein EN982_02395 [Mesorhizobium sp. M7A.F.Ca.CA.004.08.1.1]
MIVLRIAGGIREHFGMRVTEWIMTGALFGWSGCLAMDPLTFDRSPSMAIIATYGNEAFWANVCLMTALLRLGALIVNGTFKGFRYSPHFRAGASIASCVFWGQIALGVLVAVLTADGSGTGVIVYLTFMTIEMWNLFRAWADVGASQRRR